ncbi:MAG: hypothetical protein HWQ43_28545 [Nostoc sp. JL31]|uniref:hypothetical protein n=1 Tax=Nostoc sp. JL31 TaxID=2815395 RepID=UPI0025CC3E3C|nr:hypothetical protein [Nostoc sp. JL31]MBN3892906.1 hypothetical protein [Nostoc sp. JL31]
MVSSVLNNLMHRLEDMTRSQSIRSPAAILMISTPLATSSFRLWTISANRLGGIFLGV